GNNAPDTYLLQCSTSSERGLYNYEAAQIPYPDKKKYEVPVVGAFNSGQNRYVRNSDFTVQKYDVAMSLVPKKPRVMGRVMVSATEPLAHATVKLRLYYDEVKGKDSADSAVWVGCTKTPYQHEIGYTPIERTTDKNGYFEISNIIVKGSKDGTHYLGPHAEIEVIRSGYGRAFRPLPSGSGEVGFKPEQFNNSDPKKPKVDLKMGQQWDMTSGILMVPLGWASGIVQDEDGKAVRCDVQVGSGPWGRTVSEFLPSGSPGGKRRVGTMQVQLPTGKFVEKFTLPAPTGIQEIQLIPLSDQYFPFSPISQINYGSADNSTDLGVFTVKEKRHRLRVKLKAPDGNPVAGATVRLDDRTLTSDAEGMAYFEFRTPETEFRLKVTSGNYRPVDSLIVNNVTPERVTVTIELVPGMQLAGKVVTEEGQPIAGARVWVVIGADQYGPQMNQTTTGANGEYLLSGVDNGYFTVYAAKYDPQISYIGTSQFVGAPVATPSMVPPYNKQWKLSYTILKLERETDMDLTSIHGFPVEVSKRVKNTDGSYTVSGAFVNLPGNANFRLEDPAQRLVFSQVKVKKGPTNEQGVPHGVPVGGVVKTDMTHVPLKLYNGLDATLKGVQSSPGHLLGITVQGTLLASVQQGSPFGTVQIPQLGGGVRGTVSSELSSFNFSYGFTGRFYLGSEPEQPLIDAFRSSGDFPQRSFNLMTLNAAGKPADAKFSLRGFEARSDRTRSVVEPDVFRIATVIQIKNIPDITPAMLELEVGEVRVTKETIEGITGGGDKLSFQLNNWKFTSTSPWAFNNELASIVIPKGILDMGTAKADMRQIMIRPNGLEMNAENLGEVRLGDAAPIIPESNVKWEFGYDKGYLYDGRSGAWRLGLLSSNKTVATIQGPAELSPSKLALSSFSMVSRGKPLAEVRATKYRYYNIMDMDPTGTMQLTSDGVDLMMKCSMNIDGFSATDGMFSFYNQGGKTASRLKPLGATINTGRGHVYFKMDDLQESQKFKAGQFTCFGLYRIEAETGAEGAPVYARAFLDHTAGKTDIRIIRLNEGGLYEGDRKQEIVFGGSPDKKMLLNEGSQKMVSGRWNELAFKGNLVGMGDIKNDPSNELSFVVKGAVSLDKGTLKMDTMSTSFGDLTMSYDFAKARLIGNLRLEDCNFGAVNIEIADLNLLVDRDGFLVSCFKAKVHINSAPWPFQDHEPSFMVGVHGDIPPQLVTQMMSGFRLTKLPEHLGGEGKKHIMGLYLQNKMQIIDIKVPEINLVLVSVSGRAYCAAEAQIWVDLANGGSFGLGGLAYADATVVFKLLLPPCELMLSPSVELGFLAAYEKEVFTLSACAGVKVKAKFCEAEDSFNFSAKASVNS
ncbi:MAG: carboxypeptidase regulatory-like domain-containing protein, partial [Flavobacteriales bacterium]